jgi:hypothetical protein
MKYSEASVRLLSIVIRYRRGLSASAQAENTAMGPPTSSQVARR